MLIKRNKSIIVACDVPTLGELENIVKATCGLEVIGGYKIGLNLALFYGLAIITEFIRKVTNKPIIYDHQKAGNDIPAMGEKFAKVCKDAGVDAVILFPFAGIQTQTSWIRACVSNGLHVIVGGEMTHDGFFSYIKETAPDEMYKTAMLMGVTDFVLPGNKPDRIKHYRENVIEVEEPNSESIGPVTYYSPGLITQGGDITEAGKAAGDRWHAIVGSAIYKADNIKEKVEELGKQL